MKISFVLARAKSLASKTVWRERLTGLALVAFLAAVSYPLALGLGDPFARNPLLVAMLLALAIGNLFGCPDRLRPGLQYTTRTLLRLAVVLLGFRVTLMLLVDLGPEPLLIAAAVLALVFGAVAWTARRWFALDRQTAWLLACGSAVCGAAAVLAAAAMLRARAQASAVAITLITLFGTLALFIYPVAFLEGYLPGLDDDRYGIFVGATIFEIAQVVGAGYAVSELAVNTATLVKLVKVLLLVPLLLALGFYLNRRRSRKQKTRVPFPWFVAGFVAVMLFNSAVTLSGPVRGFIRDLDLFLFLMVMSALGLQTNIFKLNQAASVPRLFLAGAFSLVVAAGAGYALVRVLLPEAAVTGERAPAAPKGQETGERIFISIGCAKCHVPILGLDNERVTLYSDLLLHDMGPALDDKIVQGEAGGRDWRTAPLKGLSLRRRYLHDGRAFTLREAIVAHGGEAEVVRDRFLNLNEPEQAALYRFLNSL